MSHLITDRLALQSECVCVNNQQNFLSSLIGLIVGTFAGIVSEDCKETENKVELVTAKDCMEFSPFTFTGIAVFARRWQLALLLIVVGLGTRWRRVITILASLEWTILGLMLVELIADVTEKTRCRLPLAQGIKGIGSARNRGKLA